MLLDTVMEAWRWGGSLQHAAGGGGHVELAPGQFERLQRVGWFSYALERLQMPLEGSGHTGALPTAYPSKLPRSLFPTPRDDRSSDA